MTIDAGTWRQISDVEQVGRDMNLVIGASEVACVRSEDGSYDGYLFTNRLGSMKFIPYRKGSAGEGLAPCHVMQDEKRVRVHTAYRLPAYPLLGRSGRTSGT